MCIFYFSLVCGVWCVVVYFVKNIVIYDLFSPRRDKNEKNKIKTLLCSVCGVVEVEVVVGNTKNISLYGM